MTKSEIMALAQFNLKTMIDWISFADRKASYLLTMSLALFSVFFAVLPSASEDIHKYLFANNIALWLLAIFLILLFQLYFIFAIIGIYKLVKVITPRSAPSSVKKSFLFFETIKGMDMQVFKETLAQMDEEMIIDELNDSTYINAVIASEKYSDIGKAIRYLRLAAVAGIIAIYVVLVF
jgi:hypothetical protein